MSLSLLRAGARILLLPLVLSLFLLAPGTAHAKDAELIPSTAVQWKAKTQAEMKARAERRVEKRKRIAAKRKKAVVRVLRAVKSRAGKPYAYGSAGPNSFDCSGLTQWSYRKAGKSLPRTSGAQASKAQRVKKPRKGDLVFFAKGGRVYHVGIYAGNNSLWHASRPGTPVRKEKIWNAAHFYGRV
ncbi:C40 family peptidase [Nocardioides sp. zg-536]|uniref:C40 family peptidase n=1 Tax=Nocardioides faecalis TaxID=2803858 RepID=A0A938YC96_9ACTN|nr:C40 family peptidase [Nocardioides faecalis]MBM9461700.1 C40 family peptidase [Nocardioides faecalis]QVI59075.1 C40 family peptidase [Nocardioides faecalis]